MVSDSRVCVSKKSFIISFILFVGIGILFAYVNLFKIPREKTILKTQASEKEIIGGEETNIGKWPFMVSLVHKIPFLYIATTEDIPGFCGGTLIAEDWVLTAAHCLDFEDTPQKNIVVAIGYTNFLSEETQKHKRKFFSIDKVYIHEAYGEKTIVPYSDPDYIDNDIALIHLVPDKNYKFETVSLNNRYSVEQEKITAIVLGWGMINDHQLQTLHLQEALLPVVSNDRASRWENYHFPLSIMFAGFPGGNVDTCKGDSGGPLLVWDGEKIVQVGITSSGAGCALNKHPGNYTRVSRYLDWIEKNSGIKPNSGTYVGGKPVLSTEYLDRLSEFDEDDLSK